MTRPLRRLALGSLVTVALTSCAPDRNTVPSPPPAPTPTEPTPPEEPAAHEDASRADAAPPPAPEPAPLLHLSPEDPRAAAFERACEPGDKVTVGAVGDILMHRWATPASTPTSSSSRTW